MNETNLRAIAGIKLTVGQANDLLWFALWLKAEGYLFFAEDRDEISKLIGEYAKLYDDADAFYAWLDKAGAK